MLFFVSNFWQPEYPIPFALRPPPALLSRQSRAWKRHPLEMQTGSGVFFGCGESTYRLGVDTLTRHSSPLGIRLSPLPLTSFIWEGFRSSTERIIWQVRC